MLIIFIVSVDVAVVVFVVAGAVAVVVDRADDNANGSFVCWVIVWSLAARQKFCTHQEEAEKEVEVDEEVEDEKKKVTHTAMLTTNAGS